MRAIFIDPVAKTVTEEDVPSDNYKDLSRIIDAQGLDVSSLGSGVVCVVDDMGLYREGQRYWTFDLPGGRVLMAGKALLLSGMPDGAMGELSYKATLEFTRQIVLWLGDAAAAERAINAGLLKRPEVAVNGAVVWRWDPSKEGTGPSWGV